MGAEKLIVSFKIKHNENKIIGKFAYCIKRKIKLVQAFFEDQPDLKFAMIIINEDDLVYIEQVTDPKIIAQVIEACKNEEEKKKADLLVEERDKKERKEKRKEEKREKKAEDKGNDEKCKKTKKRSKGKNSSDKEIKEDKKIIGDKTSGESVSDDEKIGDDKMDNESKKIGDEKKTKEGKKKNSDIASKESEKASDGERNRACEKEASSESMQEIMGSAIVSPKKESIKQKAEIDQNTKSPSKSSTACDTHALLKKQAASQRKGFEKKEEHNLSLTSDLEEWDQFEANKKLFNIEPKYEEEQYTIVIDRKSKDYKAKLAEARTIASEILAMPTNDPHRLEERGVLTRTSDDDDKYSNVISKKKTDDGSRRCEIVFEYEEATKTKKNQNCRKDKSGEIVRNVGKESRLNGKGFAGKSGENLTKSDVSSEAKSKTVEVKSKAKLVVSHNNGIREKVIYHSDDSGDDGNPVIVKKTVIDIKFGPITKTGQKNYERAQALKAKENGAQASMDDSHSFSPKEVGVSNQEISIINDSTVKIVEGKSEVSEKIANGKTSNVKSPPADKTQNENLVVDGKTIGVKSPNKRISGEKMQKPFMTEKIAIKKSPNASRLTEKMPNKTGSASNTPEFQKSNLHTKSTNSSQLKSITKSPTKNTHASSTRSKSPSKDSDRPSSSGESRSLSTGETRILSSNIVKPTGYTQSKSPVEERVNYYKQKGRYGDCTAGTQRKLSDGRGEKPHGTYSTKTSDHGKDKRGYAGNNKFKPKDHDRRKSYDTLADASQRKPVVISKSSGFATTKSILNLGETNKYKPVQKLGETIAQSFKGSTEAPNKWGNGKDFIELGKEQHLKSSKKNEAIIYFNRKNVV